MFTSGKQEQFSCSCFGSYSLTKYISPNYLNLSWLGVDSVIGYLVGISLLLRRTRAQEGRRGGSSDGAPMSQVLWFKSPHHHHHQQNQNRDESQDQKQQQSKVENGLSGLTKNSLTMPSRKRKTGFISIIIRQAINSHYGTSFSEDNLETCYLPLLVL
jgi:hypothetical protein